MTDNEFIQLLDLATGVVLVCAFIALWRRGLVAIVRALAIQGVALAGVALLVGVRAHDLEPIGVAALVLALKGVVVPFLLLRVVRSSDENREVDPVVNVTASLIAGASLTLIAYAVTRDVVALEPSPETRALPIGVAVILIGLFVLASRRKAVSQIVGFLLLDNGIALIALLATAGIPLIIELGVTLDVLLVVLILQILTSRLITRLGTMDLDQLRELHD
jgi:hydrogenase-4 component E